MAFADVVLGLSPDLYYRFGEASGETINDASGTGAHLAAYSPFTMTWGQPGVLTSDVDTSATIGDAHDADNVSGSVGALFNASTKFSVMLWFKTDCYIKLTDQAGASQFIIVYHDSAGEIRSGIYAGQYEGTAYAKPATGWSMVAFVYDAGSTWLYVDGVLRDTGVAGPASLLPSTDSQLLIGGAGNVLGAGMLMDVDEVALWDGAALTAADVTTLWEASQGNFPLQGLTMAFQGWVGIDPVALPMALSGGTLIDPVALPMAFSVPDPSHYQSSAARFSVGITIDGVDVSSDLLGPVTIEHSENASGLADFTIIPPVGTISPADYEGKSVTVTYEGRDIGGALLYVSPRFTGEINRASYDPDVRELEIAATTDLQGRVENLSRSQIAAIVGGIWSEHVFDDTADGWQYAQDRLITAESEIHVDQHGLLVAVPWAGNPVDGIWTDAVRFPENLELERVPRRDLLTRVRLNMEFRYTRLRHREITVTVANSLTLCGWLNGEGELLEKSQIVSAADGSAWTRQGEIFFYDLPDQSQANICGGTNYTRNDSDAVFCLGGTWKAARRWGQVVTEVYTLDVVAPDLEENNGVQAIEYDYGIEAVYDSADYERSLDFDSPPVGAVFSGNSNDYQLAATDAERTGRIASEDMQRCALRHARGLIRERARRNFLPISVVYDPSVSLASVRQVTVDGLDTTAKVSEVRETLDPVRAQSDMTVRLAISRHNGTGSVSNSPLDPAPEPTQPAETNTGRSYVVGHHSGGVTGAAPDDENWDGWITNAYGTARTDPANLYRERLVLNMPEIEDTARAATEVTAAQTYTCAIPEDPLSMSN